MPRPTMKQVFSSHVHALGYDPESRELHVNYKGGGTYVYKDVDAAKARQVMHSGSIGKALHQHVRGQHDHEVL